MASAAPPRDGDNDGYQRLEHAAGCTPTGGSVDCNDTLYVAGVHPNAREFALDGIDQNCNGADVLLSSKLIGGVNDFDDASLCSKGLDGTSANAPFIGDWDVDGDIDLFFEPVEQDLDFTGLDFIPGEHLAWDDADAWVPQQAHPRNTA